jgi:hypothetical protein
MDAVNVSADRDVMIAVPQRRLDNLHVPGGVIHPRAEAMPQRMEPELLVGPEFFLSSIFSSRKRR